jgi:hypothetical protein
MWYKLITIFTALLSRTLLWATVVLGIVPAVKNQERNSYNTKDGKTLARH